MTMRKDWLVNVKNSSVKEIIVANKEKLIVECVGDVNIKLCHNNVMTQVTIYDVLFVPNLTTNLLSVSQIVKRGSQVDFDATGCEISNDGKVIATAQQIDNIYKLVHP